MKSFTASQGFRLAPESKERATDDDQHKIKMHSMITFWDVRVEFDDIHNAGPGLEEVQRVVRLKLMCTGLEGGKYSSLITAHNFMIHIKILCVIITVFFRK